MPTVNQDGLNTLMSTANNNAQSLSDTLATGAKNMCDAIGSVWACPQAQKFAAEFQTKMNNVANNFRENMSAFQSNINANTQRYNQQSQTSLAVPSVNYSDPTIDVSGIHAQLGDGSVGIIEGANESVVNALTNAITSMVSTVDTTKNGISASGAFDTDEAEAASGMYSKLGNILTTSSTELEESVKRYIQETIEQYGTIKRTNINTSNEA